MKIHAERKALAEAIGWVAKAVSKNPPQPALAGIRLAADGGTLTARSFDYDVSHSATLDVDVEAKGECLVSGRFLAWIVASIGGDSVELVLDDEQLTVACGNSTYRATVLRIEDYPTLPTQPAKVGVVDASALEGIVAAARLFVDNDASLAVLASVHLEGDDSEITAVGLRSTGANIATARWVGTTFEANPLPSHLDGALKGLSGEVTIGFEGGVLGLADARRSVTLRTLGDGFAQWRRLVREPEDDAFEAIVELADLTDAVKRAGTLCDDETPLAITFGRTEIEVAIAGGERGAGSDVVAAECGGEKALGVDARFLLSGLGAMPAGPVRIGLGAGGSSKANTVIIRPLDSSDRLALVMPKTLPGGTR